MVYLCVVEGKDYCVHKEGKPFSLQEYAINPEHFYSVFHEKYAPHATAIVNGIYWEARYPRILTKLQIDNLLKNPNSKLATIADISCDIEVSKMTE
jgi:alpha-aminoadipic semialdehyde synthase